MTRSVVLLRGINVGGNRKIAMADLRRQLAADGFHDVQTYIQSGNVVLDHDFGDSEALAAAVGRSILALTGFEVPTMARDAEEWDRIIAANPYVTDDADPTHLHLLGLEPSGSTAAFAALDLEGFAPERATVADHEVYLHLPDGMGRSKLAVALAAVKVPTTARNWRTVLALRDLLAT